MSSTTIHPWPGPGVVGRAPERRAPASRPVAPGPVARPPAVPLPTGIERAVGPEASSARANASADAVDGSFPVSWIPLAVPGLALLTAGSIALVWAWAL